MRGAETLQWDERTSAYLRIVPVADLNHTLDGPTRGYAHIGFDGHPVDAPGHLDFEPLLLFAVGEMRPGEGLPMHRHEHIENLILMRQGSLQHRDSAGAACTLSPHDVSNLSAGVGVEHSEWVVGDRTVHAVVIWIRSAHPTAAPTFRRRTVAHEARRDRLVLLASGRPVHASLALAIDEDVALYGGHLRIGATVSHDAGDRRRVYLVPLDGTVEVAGRRVEAHERLLADGGGILPITALEPTEVVLLDLPPSSP